MIIKLFFIIHEYWTQFTKLKRSRYVGKQMRVAYNLTSAIMKLKFRRYGYDGLTSKIKNRIRYEFTYHANTEITQMKKKEGVLH